MVKYRLLGVAIVAILFIAGCGEDDKITNQEEHFDAVGILFRQSGVTVFDYYGPDYTASDSIASRDTLRLSLGLGPHLKAYFYDEDGEIINPPLTPAEGGHQTFAATFTPQSMAELWWHEGEEGNFEFHTRGFESGSGRVKFNVMHYGHSDFTTLPIPVVVDTVVLHDAPIGVKLRDEESGQLLATAWLADSNKVQGNLSVSANDSTDHIEAIFFDKYDVEFWPDVPPHSLVVTSANSAVVTIGGQEQEEPWAFKLYGHSAGATTVTVYIYHDGVVGKTFATIPVVVQ